jgi:hypothetical protein
MSREELQLRQVDTQKSVRGLVLLWAVAIRFVSDRSPRFSAAQLLEVLQEPGHVVYTSLPIFIVLVRGSRQEDEYFGRFGRPVTI